jgi:hypothetical protein
MLLGALIAVWTASRDRPSESAQFFLKRRLGWLIGSYEVGIELAFL